jgi:hypothetical protein
MLKNSYFISGLVSLCLSLLIYFVAIPFAITSPSNVSKIVLSPLFWPQVLSIILGLTGISLMLAAKKTSDLNDSVPLAGGYKRLILMIILMGLYLAAIPSLGLVWTSMIAFVALSILIKSSHPRTAIIMAIVIPLALYMFFAHVAGISIPQGEFLRLP